jgi:hypothetical protein
MRDAHHCEEVDNEGLRWDEESCLCLMGKGKGWLAVPNWYLISLDLGGAGRYQLDELNAVSAY